MIKYIIGIFILIVLISCTKAPRPRCYWPNPGCDCWYVCDINSKNHFDAAGFPTIVEDGRYFHWRRCEVIPR